MGSATRGAATDNGRHLTGQNGAALAAELRAWQIVEAAIRAASGERRSALHAELGASCVSGPAIRTDQPERAPLNRV